MGSGSCGRGSPGRGSEGVGSDGLGSAGLGSPGSDGSEANGVRLPSVATESGEAGLPSGSVPSTLVGLLGAPPVARYAAGAAPRASPLVGLLGAPVAGNVADAPPDASPFVRTPDALPVVGNVAGAPPDASPFVRTPDALPVAGNAACAAPFVARSGPSPAAKVTGVEDVERPFAAAPGSRPWAEGTLAGSVPAVPVVAEPAGEIPRPESADAAASETSEAAPAFSEAGVVEGLAS